MPKKEKVFRIIGRVIDRVSRNGIAGVRVEAWDKDLVFNDLVGSTVTDAQGAFQIEFNESYFKELFFDRQPDLFFKVFQDGRLIRSTEDSVLWNVTDEVTETVIEGDFVSGPTQPDQPGRVTQEVKGTVRFADGLPGFALLVSAFDRDLRSAQKLGESHTDSQGAYRIEYHASQFQKLETDGADLEVKVFDPDGSLLVTSPILFNAPPAAQIDLTIPADVLEQPPLFERIARALAPLRGELQVQQLEESKEHQDLSFLSGETRFAANVLARFVIAHRLAGEELPAQFWFVLLGEESVYQFDQNQTSEAQMAAVMDILPRLDREAVRKSLARGFNAKEIPASLRDHVDGWIEAFLQLIARRSLDESQPNSVKSVLEEAGIKDAKRQETFARLFQEHGALTPELIATLEKDKSFKKGEITDLRTSFQLADLTNADFSVVKALKSEFKIRQPEEIRKLAKKSRQEWVDFVKTKHAAGEVKLPFETSEIAGIKKMPATVAFGSMLENQFRQAFPTAAFVGQLERALQNGGASGLTRAAEVGRFLNRHENFELLNTSVDEFFKRDIDPDLAPLARDDEFKQEIKAVQRVFKLAPTFAQTNALLADDLHSAQQIYRRGRSEFVRSYADREGFTSESAAIAWDRAADTHAATLTMVTELTALEADALPFAMRRDSEALSSFPNWDQLFRTGDLCECEHCRSVLDPYSVRLPTSRTC
jgi:hypothetical protein